jgi:hypothetical protein
MIDTKLDLSDEDDVYANLPRDRRLDTDVGHYELVVVSEAAPTALARIFGLLSSLSIVPLSTSSLQCDNTVSLNLKFNDVDLSTADLLQRKIAQLTETVEIRGCPETLELLTNPIQVTD